MTNTRIPGQTAIVLLASLGLAACTTTQTETSTAPAASAEAPAAQGPADIDTLFDRYDAAQLEMSPLTKAYRGIRDEDYGAWGDFSDRAEVREQALLQDTAAAMREGYDVAALSPQDALSYRLFDAMAKRSASLFPYRDYGYIFDQMSGAQSQLPAFLINIHAVQNADQAADYVSRIEGLGDVIDTLTAQSRERADAGVMPPDWVYPYVISDVRNLLDAGENSAVLEDFRGKVEALDLSAADTAALEAAATKAWNASAVPAYQRLLAEMERQQGIAPTDDGIWRFPEGEAYYAALLKNYTTTDLTADQIHRIGRENVSRIHDEMRAIMDQVGFEGSLQEFFEFTRTDARFYYDTREAYLADAQARLDAMEAKLPEFFATLPKAPLQVKPVEAFRE